MDFSEFFKMKLDYERIIKMKNIGILAQAESVEESSGIEATKVTEEQMTTKTAADGNAPAVAPRQKPGGMQPLILFGLMAVVMYFLLFRGPRKKQQQHKQMVQSLKKNDRVRTIGGIIGIIVDVKDDEITLKIDEANNTKIKVISSAIGRNMSEEKA